MKKFPSILFVFSLLFMLTACSSSADPSQESSGQTTSPSSQQDSVSVSNAVLESESTESEQSANNTLIVYFSRWGNTEYPSDVDAITSASIVVDNNSRYGTTEYVANMIAENVGGDLHRIETVTPYTADFDELRDVNHDEMSRNYLPELKESNLDISAYDTVFIGYPVWATDVPQAVLSFLKEYDLSGKTVIPFCTHDGYGAGKPDESNSGEIKCMALVRMIYGDSGWDKKMSYRLIGRAFPQQRLVSFKITDAMQIENGRVLTEM